MILSVKMKEETPLSSCAMFYERHRRRKMNRRLASIQEIIKTEPIERLTGGGKQ